MTRKQLVLDRYEIVGTAGTGGFGTVQIAWDPRIQRKVAIKTIQLTEHDAERAALSGANPRVQESDAEETPELADEVASADTQKTILLEEAAPQKALSPAEARSARAAAQQEAEEERRALSLSWENPWVKIPDEASVPVVADDVQDQDLQDNAPTDVSLSADTTGKLEAVEGPTPKSDEATEGQGASAPNTSSRSLSESLPPVIKVPEINRSASEHTQELEAVVHPAQITAEIPVISEETQVLDEVVEDTAEEPSEDGGSDPTDFDDPAKNPSFIIAEARESLKDLASFDAPTSSDGRFPWENDSRLQGAYVPLTATREFTKKASKASSPSRPSSFESASVENEAVRSDEPITTLVHVPGLDEARTAAKLSDPRIVTVYDFEVRGTTAYLIMEYVEGITLSQLLDDYPNYITLDMVTGVFDAVAGALEVAHDAGVLHLDIKPDNIIINKDGQVKVTDFGLATLADASGHGFAGGGTIGYMPLEQMRREELDVRTDEWALASMTYEMLTGGNPFNARTLDQAQQAILNAELVLPSLCWPRVDSQLDDVLFFALDPDREERYETIEDFADEVDKFLGDPDSGQQQLALVVEDALSQPEPEPEQPEPSEPQRRSLRERTGVLGLLDRFGLHRSSASDDGSERTERRSRTRFLPNERTSRDDYPEFAPSDRLAEKLEKYGPDDALYEDDYYEEDRKEREPVEHIPLYQRIPEALVAFAGRAFNGVGCAFVTGLAFWNFDPIRSIPDEGAFVGAVVGALIFGALGIIVPTYGALVAYCLLGLVLCLCGHPIVGAVLIIATCLWWYVLGRDGVAENNIALLGPLSMSVGVASITPVFAGASLKPLQAAVTMFYSVILVCIFSSFGGDSFIGWEAFGFPTLSGSDITLAFARMFARPLTLTMAVGWIAGAAIFAALNTRSSRWTFIIGLVLCVACVLAGSLVFMPPTPQLIVSVIVAAGVLLAIFV